MSLVQMKCPACSAGLNVSSAASSGFCEYCGSAWQNPSAVVPLVAGNSQPSPNFAWSNNQPAPRPPSRPRPRIKIPLFIVSLLWWPAAIIYIVCIRNAQRKWDEEHRV